MSDERFEQEEPDEDVEAHKKHSMARNTAASDELGTDSDDVEAHKKHSMARTRRPAMSSARIQTTSRLTRSTRWPATRRPPMSPTATTQTTSRRIAGTASRVFTSVDESPGSARASSF